MNWDDLDEDAMISEIIYCEDPYEKIETILYSSEDSDQENIEQPYKNQVIFSSCKDKMVYLPETVGGDTIRRMRNYLSNLDKETLLTALKMSPEVLHSILSNLKANTAGVSTNTLQNINSSLETFPWFYEMPEEWDEWLDKSTIRNCSV
jgi:hypothetical protein